MAGKADLWTIFMPEKLAGLIDEIHKYSYVLGFFFLLFLLFLLLEAK